MLVRRFVAGLALAGAVVGVWAPAAQAAVTPSLDDIRRNIKELRLAPPSVGTPQVDPSNPQLPNPPFVQIPAGLSPALGVLSPAGVTTCQAAYLGPLLGAVGMTMLLDQLPPGSVPLQPSFLGPAFGPVTTTCVLAPFPRYTACTNDKAIADQSEAVPAPFASAVTEIDAVQKIVSYYLLNREPFGRDIAGNMAKRLGCR